MTNKNKRFEPLAFSTIGVAAMFLILVAVYVISGVVKHRFDFTQEKLYTLSPGTKAILGKLDTPVEIRFYCTQDTKEMPVVLKTYAQRVEDLLAEIGKQAGNKIEIKKFDPKPDTDAEDSARLDGLEGQMVNLNDKIYLGLAVSQLDQKVSIPFLAPDREKLLEYDLARAISRVSDSSKPVVGVMAGLPVFGEINPMAMRMGQMQRQDPWVFVTELKRDFEVKQVEMTAEEIPGDVKVLIVVHPKGITDKTQYAIDQFVLKGGKLVAFLDPLSIVDSRNAPGMNPMQAASQSGSTLDKLVKAWGLEFDQNKVAADMNFITRINRGGRGEQAPAFLTMTQEGMNRDDVITSQLDSAWIPFSGAFTGTPAEGLKQTVLLRTTQASQLVERFMAEFSGEQTVKDFTAAGKELALAVRLNGKFKTAFPDGKPKDAAADKPEEKKDGEKKEETKTADGSLKESSADGAVILVGDADMLVDQFAVREMGNFFGQKIYNYANGNLSFLQNVVEQLSGDSNLISVRSRATMSRPFTLVRQMQNQAEDRYRTKIKDLEKNLSDTQTKLNELQRNRESGQGQRFVLSPEQQAEIEKFKTKQAQVNRELRQERRNLRRDIDSLENRLKWVNIAGMPLLVALSGIALALVKQKRTAAK